MIISTDTKKDLTESNIIFCNKNTLRTERNGLNLIKGIYKNIQLASYFMEKDYFPLLIPGIRQGFPVSSRLYQRF